MPFRSVRVVAFHLLLVPAALFAGLCGDVAAEPTPAQPTPPQPALQPDPQPTAQPVMTADLQPGTPAALCLSAIAAAEQAEHLPPQLLRSIALVESARADPTTGRIAPWPWTINVGGTGHFYASKDQAVAAVRQLQANGVRSIDVGCAQVNLMYHPNAFTSLDAAFDPAANTAYAARFLNALRRTVRDWPLAAAAYHSQVARTGRAYAHRVLAIWPVSGGGLLPGPGFHEHTPLNREAPMARFAVWLRHLHRDRVHDPSLRPSQAARHGWGGRLTIAAHGLRYLPRQPTWNRQPSGPHWAAQYYGRGYWPVEGSAWSYGYGTPDGD